MNIILLLTGSTCIISAVVGGKLKRFGVAIPVLESVNRRLILAALGIGLIAASTANVFPSPFPPAPISSPSPPKGEPANTTPIPVDGNVQQAKLIQRTKPIYPPLAKAAHLQGTVKFEATIGRDGTVRDLRLLSGQPLLVQSAMQAVKQWVYKPTLLNGQAVEVITTIDVNIAASTPNRSPAALPPPSDEDTLEASLKRLRSGNLAYSTPQKMKTGQNAQVTARIAAALVPPAELTRGLSDDSSGLVESTVVESTKVSTKMKMTLSGADFTITPLSPVEQFIDNESATQWQWDVRPKRRGTLRLRLAAIVEINDLSKEFTTVDREITVQVDLTDQVSEFWKGNWQWSIATLVALGGASLKWRQSRKKSS